MTQNHPQTDQHTSSIKADTVGGFLDALGSKQPAPGGGAVAGLCGAIGAALAQMVNSYSTGRKSLALHTDALAADARLLTQFRDEMLWLADEDARAYAKLNAIERLDADDPARAGYDEAVRDAIAVPSRVMVCAGELLLLVERMVGRSNPWLMSDLAIAAILADACCRAGAWNVRVNAGSVRDVAAREALVRDAESRIEASSILCAQVERLCKPENQS
ncbi:MAG: cyclodeaminase/cyclohydrolase family protein [Phycisphaeraceae bacterium]|nr:cyclodeaminase/cyclohydrolase family protein [Phycisphaerales bacterium]MCB9859848.1 cyclodeaminase/cyclohydrolase family protein [Phycisphaeraceae bacterium]